MSTSVKSGTGASSSESKHLFDDLKAGFVLFLIALPLSVGIAIASGAPPSAGLLAAIIGGIIGSFLGGSQLTINGPAAGLIVVVFGAVEALGQGNQMAGFRYFLAAMVAAGVLQILMGLFRMASIGLAFPSAVIHGMLSAIGAIIIAKQIPIMLGVKAKAPSIFGLFMEVPHDLGVLNPEVAFIGITSLFLLFAIPKLPIKSAKKIPAPLVVVCLGVVLGKYFDIEHQHVVRFLGWKGEVNRTFLLNIPSNLLDAVVFPDFGKFLTLANFSAVMSIAIIATIESVLSTVAVDKLDPQKRVSDLNRDLLSKGLCNCILGMIGGLPIISEIVRSSANIDTGAKTKFSNFFHGIFILSFLILFPELLHAIPMACLAAILIFVGWRLAHPSQFLHAFHIGPDHITSFIVTFVVTIATDLLIGVAAGVVTEVAIAMIHGVRIRDLFAFKYNEGPVKNGGANVMVSSSVVFTNSLKLNKILQKHLNEGNTVVLDLQQSRFIDHTVLDQIARHRMNFENRGIQLTAVFHNAHKPFSKHPLAARKIAT